MSDSITREWLFYLDDMIGFAQKVLAYTEGLGQNGFVAGGITYDATLRNLEPSARRRPISRTRFELHIQRSLGG